VELDPIAFWNGPGAERWVTHNERFDRVFRPHGELAIDAARFEPRQRVLDVGCGCGDTTLAIRGRVAPGTVLGLDVSEPMVARARERAEGIASTSFVVADATTHGLEPGSFDVVFSRFGVMFFTDPVRAFANLRAATAEDGRLAAVVWRAPSENPWTYEPVEALRGIIEPPREPVDGEPGPFSFGDPERVKRILGEAGWRDVVLTAQSPDAVLSETGDREEALAIAMAIGAAGRALQTADAATRERAREPLLEWIERYAGDRGVRVPTAVWVITASRGGS
jgi:SAM-dependent methyltransferase